MSKKDYTKFANKDEKENEKPEIIIEKPIEKEVPKDEHKVELKIGTVVNCTSLNVRKEPNKNASIMCTIKVSEKVEIDESKSTNEFYKIFNSAGVEGYCMKNYISID